MIGWIVFWPRANIGVLSSEGRRSAARLARQRRLPTPHSSTTLALSQPCMSLSSPPCSPTHSRTRRLLIAVLVDDCVRAHALQPPVLGVCSAVCASLHFCWRSALLHPPLADASVDFSLTLSPTVIIQLIQGATIASTPLPLPLLRVRPRPAMPRCGISDIETRIGRLKRQRGWR